MDSAPSTILGPLVVEEPDTYDFESPKQRLPMRHRLRRASSLTLLSERNTSIYKDSSILPTLGDYQRKSRSTVTLPACTRRTSTALYGLFPRRSRGVITAPPELETKDAEPDETESPSEVDYDYVPTTPQYAMERRYERTIFHPESYEDEHPILSPLHKKFNVRPLETPTNDFQWTRKESPEGAVYYHERTRNILTYADLHDRELRDGVSDIAAQIFSRLESMRSQEDDTEIVIVARKNLPDDIIVYGYYLASWDDKCVFWLDEMHFDEVTGGSRICISDAHLGKYVEQLFWYVVAIPIMTHFDPCRVHVEMFPCDHTISAEDLHMLKIEFNNGIYDHVTSHSSLFPYDEEEANKILRCLERIDPAHSDPRELWIIARSKQNILEHAFLNYHGERGARIHRNDSVLEPSIRGKRSLLFKILSPFLFFMPNVYMEALEHVWIDRTVDWITWRRFISMLVRDWEQSITPATVILSANVGFLAIQSIDTGESHRSAEQISSYVSAVLALFNYIVCQILYRHHRHSDQFGAPKAREFLQRREEQWFGLESVAVTFSLPTGLFIWSMLTFLAALMVVFFYHTTFVTKLVCGLIMGVLLSIVIALIFLDWEGHATSQDQSLLYYILPAGLRNLVSRMGGIKLKPRFKLRTHARRSTSSLGSSTSTAVNSVGPCQ